MALWVQPLADPFLEENRQSVVADPAGIYMTFADSSHHERLRLDSVTCVVDADQIFEYIDRGPDLLSHIIRQIGFADLDLHNKVDLVGAERVEWLRSWIDQMMDRLRLVETTHRDVPWEVLLSTDTSVMRLFETSDNEEHDHLHDHGDAFDHWTFEPPEPLTLAALEEMVRLRLPCNVYRLKGFVRTIDDPEHRYVVLTVGRRSEIRRHDRWGDRSPGTKLVAIGAAGRLDENWLHDALSECARSALMAEAGN